MGLCLSGVQNHVELRHQQYAVLSGNFKMNILIIILLLEIRKLKYREIYPSHPANRVKENLVPEPTA